MKRDYLDEENTCLEVFPTLGFSTGRELHTRDSEMARRIIKALSDARSEVERHVDVDHVYLHIVYGHECEFCESVWTEDTDAYNGGCCDEDEKHKPVEDQP